MDSLIFWVTLRETVLYTDQRNISLKYQLSFNVKLSHTLMFPSADPLMNLSSVESTARALTGES